MIKITLITLFQDFCQQLSNYSIIKKAIQLKKIKLTVLNLRQFGIGARHQVDDYQFGGGEGMVLMAPVVVRAIESVKTKKSIVVLLSPQGQVWNNDHAHKTMHQLLKNDHDLIIVCGHYEGFDQRIFHYVDQVVSIGDYVLTGGEIASLVIIDSLVRLIPNVIKVQSVASDSFQSYLLDYDVYTRPLSFRNRTVPQVLLSGHHGQIQQFRWQNQLAKTKQQRPDLYQKYLTIQQTLKK